MLVPLPATGAPPGLGGVLAAVADEPDGVPWPVVRAPLAVARSLATDRLAAATPVATPFNTFMARFISPIVSAIALAETLPARSRSSTASLKRVKMLVGCV